MISGIIKVEVSVISRSRRLRQITLTETLIIPDITKTESNNCFITGLPVWQTQSESGWDLFVFFFSFFSFFLFFSVSVKVLPVTPLLSGIFVHRAFCSYFLRIERVVEMRRFLWCTQ